MAVSQGRGRASNSSGRPRRAAPGRPRPSRRDQLLRAGAALFAQRGFAGTSVDDLGAAAGVSGPALYHHFDGKEAMLGEMLVGISRSLLARGRAIVADVGREERLAALIAMHVDFAVDDHDLITVHQRDLVHARPADQRRVRDLQGAYVDIWVDEVVSRQPGLGVPTARAAVHAVFGLLNSTPHSGRLPRADLVALLRTTATGAFSALGDLAGDRCGRPASGDPAGTPPAADEREPMWPS